MAKNSNLIYLEQFNIEEQLKKLKNKLKNKRILLYGAGEILSVLKQNYSLEPLNIIGIADRRFIDSDQEFFEGYKTYTPEDILELKPDYVLITTKIYVYIIENLVNNLPIFSKIKFLPILQKPSKTIFQELVEVQSLFNYIIAFKRTLAYKIYEKTNLSLFMKKIIDTRNIKDFFNVLRFKMRKLSHKTVLIIEINSCHGETIPSVYKYYSSLGFEVDILVNAKLHDIEALKCIKKSKVKIFPVSVQNIDKCIKDVFLQKYDYIFYNSCNIYKNNKAVNLFDFYPIKSINKKICGYVHRIELFNNSDICTPFILANMPNTIDAKTLNPHYFGEVKINPKNKITNFITVGNIEAKRKNHNLLIDATNDLYQKGYRDFKITVVGQGDLKSVPQYLRPFFNLTGRLTYPDMYKEMEKSDFFLPLLDPNNSEHDRYITVGTSGSFQLIYGFCKPCLIHEKFAKTHGFNDSNSLIYKNNEDLSLFMESAIKLNQEKYEYLQNNIKELANNLYNESLKNLQTVLNVK